MAITSPLDSKIKGLAAEPGVYLMKDSSGEILYVGKAKNLKSRVSSYFQESDSNRSPRIELLVRRIADFEVVITDNEVEALVLECNLIKKYKPRFNVRLKDDKAYPYVRLNIQHPYPKLEYVRRVKKDGARYFGPYVSAFEIKEILRWAQKAFQLRDCSDNEFRNRSRPCILHQMGQCSAPCVKLIDEKSYGDRIQTVLRLLDGKGNEVVRELKKQMQEASENQEFERAAVLRDRLHQIDQINQEQKISNPESDLDRDLVHFARNTNQAVIVVMSVREGSVVGVFQYPFEDVEPSISDDEFLFEFLAQYYLKRYEETPQFLPQEVLMPQFENPEVQQSLLVQTLVLGRALARRVDFRVPKKGEAADLEAMVKKTAAHHLSELSANVAHAAEDLADVQRKLDLRRFPHRIECFDISHFQGEGTVASRVVFIDGKPDKSLYRKYHVKDVGNSLIGNIDDFKSLREVLERRFANDSVMPDLVIIDGGKGQLSQAEAIFEELGVVGVDLVSLAKARTQSDFKETEVVSSLERVFKPNQKNPILLKPGTGVFRVLTQARDESHRFAITFHRSVRDKRILSKKKK